jgi:tRNA 2-thiouridine synthesizing protein A
MLELDARKLLCPMPVIRLQNKIKTLKTGDRLRIVCTDPGTHHDIPAWCRMYSHKILTIETLSNEIHFVIEVT